MALFYLTEASKKISPKPVLSTWVRFPNKAWIPGYWVRNGRRRRSIPNHVERNRPSPIRATFERMVLLQENSKTLIKIIEQQLRILLSLKKLFRYGFYLT